MGVWIMSIVGVISLGILLEIVLPEGQTAKYVKGAFSLLVVFVIAMPLPNLLGKEWKLDLSGSTFAVDEDFINSTQAMYSGGVENTLKSALKEQGYECEVSVITKSNAPIVIDRVEVVVVNFKQEVADAVRIEVKSIVADTVSVPQSSVKVDVIPI